jgi:putative DNA methylase
MAIVAEGKRQRYYVAPNSEHVEAAFMPRPSYVPEEELAIDPRNLWTVNYGLTQFADLFTNRQLTALTTFSDLVLEVRDAILAAGGQPEYANGVATYLAFGVSKLTDRHSTIVNWYGSRESTSSTFARQAIPMTWDFVETQPLLEGTGTFWNAIEWVADLVKSLPASKLGYASQSDARTGSYKGSLVSTDPPYYDNISYANLSDYFYVWLRRSLAQIYPDLLGTVLTPKADELVADPLRHGDKDRAAAFFEEGFTDVFRRVCEGAVDSYPITVFYAFKQAETDGEGDHASTGWETLLEGLLSLDPLGK